MTVNSRLGPMGYMAHPALTAESEHAASGNYGTLDLIASLEWVQANIEAFGGDPDNVLIFGGSGAGTRTLSLMASPLAEGLVESPPYTDQAPRYLDVGRTLEVRTGIEDAYVPPPES